MKRYLLVVLVLSIFALSFFFQPVQAEETLDLTEYPLSEQVSSLYRYDLEAGIDNSFWGIGPDGIVKISLTGKVTKYGTASSRPSQYQIAAGSDGNMWYPWLLIEDNGPVEVMVKMNKDGQSTSYPTDLVIPAYIDLIRGTGNELWSANLGSIGIFDTSTNAYSHVYTLENTQDTITALAYGLNNNIWFATVSWSNPNEGESIEEMYIHKMSPQGSAVKFVVPDLNAVSPNQIVSLLSGPDGNIWFADYYGDVVGKITPGGTITQYQVPKNSDLLCLPSDLLSGPDGNIWFYCSQSGSIGRITLDGNMTLFPLSITHLELKKGPDGNIWAVGEDKIVLIKVIGTPPPPPPITDRYEYVALGDSVSSGEGVEPYFESGSKCHRSKKAYPALVKPPFISTPFAELKNSQTYGWGFLACSGNTIAGVKNDINTKKSTYLTNKNFLKLGVDTKLVTITAGANDLEWSSILKMCGVNRLYCPADEYKNKNLILWIKDRIAQKEQELTALYQDIHAKAPNARIVVMGYPQLFPATTEEQKCVKLAEKTVNKNLSLGFSTMEQYFFRSAVTDFNAAIKRAVEKSGVPGIKFISVEEAFAGHEVCGNKGEWINGLSLRTKNGVVVPYKRSDFEEKKQSFHPNALGHEAYARLINELLTPHF